MAPLLPSHRRPGSGGGGSGNKALIKVLLLAMGLGGIIMMQSFASKLGTRPIPTPDPRAYIHTTPMFDGCFFTNVEEIL